MVVMETPNEHSIKEKFMQISNYLGRQVKMEDVAIVDQS